jgi:SAM-dependent methyltransferase
MLQNWIRGKLHNEAWRQQFVAEALATVPEGAKLLDAGCGSQQYRKCCGHLHYFGQDFGEYQKDHRESFTDGLGGEQGYKYGKLDYKSDIWSIQEKDNFFDAVLCTEVFEHIPYPIETIHEFSRLLKKNGKLILTAPSNCLRHMDPYFFYSGFSDNFFREILESAGFDVMSIEPIGDYYAWIAAELARSARDSGFFSRLLIGPALLWFMNKKPTKKSTNTLCFGYHVIAVKK